jgi:hypothetical protein
MKNRPTTTIDLEYSVEVDGVQVSTLAMRRPTVADQLAFEDGKGTEAKRTVNMMAALCDVPPATIQQLDIVDFQKVAEVLAGFTGPQGES